MVRIIYWDGANFGHNGRWQCTDFRYFIDHVHSNDRSGNASGIQY